MKSIQLKDIRDLTIEELKSYLVSIGEKPFRAQQIFDWIYKKGASTFGEFKNLPQPLLDKLAKDFAFTPVSIVEELQSTDGTQKFLFGLKDGENVESVLIPTKDRATACISSQVGCKFGCRFCASGVAGWKRNLTPAEILSQVLHVKKSAHKDRPLTHIVFMGIGEPLDNYENLVKAIDLINGKEGVELGARKITVSTSGVVPKILQLAKEDVQLELAVSLHGYDNQSRDVLMPVNKKYPIEVLIDAVREYQKAKKRMITFEYIMINGVTVTPEAPAKLKALFKGIMCKMNLIPYNSVAEYSQHKCPSMPEMKAFQKALEAQGILSTIRTPRGSDVAAACGQLRHAHQKLK
jgi:23S rRNA (adenine2503-C2)-methyltransferase